MNIKNAFSLAIALSWCPSTTRAAWSGSPSHCEPGQAVRNVCGSNAEAACKHGDGTVQVHGVKCTDSNPSYISTSIDAEDSDWKGVNSAAKKGQPEAWLTCPSDQAIIQTCGSRGADDPKCNENEEVGGRLDDDTYSAIKCASLSAGYRLDDATTETLCAAAGTFVSCPRAYIATSFCGSGAEASCGSECTDGSSSTTGIVCTKLESIIRGAWSGQAVKCDPGEAVRGVCGSNSGIDQCLVGVVDGSQVHTAICTSELYIDKSPAAEESDWKGIDSAANKDQPEAWLTCPSGQAIIQTCGSRGPDQLKCNTVDAALGDNDYSAIKCASLSEDYTLDAHTTTVCAKEGEQAVCPNGYVATSFCGSGGEASCNHGCSTDPANSASTGLVCNKVNTVTVLDRCIRDSERLLEAAEVAISGSDVAFASLDDGGIDFESITNLVSTGADISPSMSNKKKFFGLLKDDTAFNVDYSGSDHAEFEEACKLIDFGFDKLSKKHFKCGEQSFEVTGMPVCTPPSCATEDDVVDNLLAEWFKVDVMDDDVRCVVTSAAVAFGSMFWVIAGSLIVPILIS